MVLEQDFIYYRAWARRIMEAANDINLDDVVTVCEFALKEFSREFTLEEGQTVLTIINNWKVGKTTYPPGYEEKSLRVEIANRLERLAKMVRDGDETLVEIEETRQAMLTLDTIER